MSARGEETTGSRALATCMQVLVLCNLGFVHLTGAAGWHWVGPLFALALAAPQLARFREAALYRLTWNAGVVAFFFLLLFHAVQADLASVLEDGMVMAVLCQVHLLNNLRATQRPDLLFLNAFLITIITGFMSRGIGFPLVFAVFAPSFVVGLQLLSASRDGRPHTATDDGALVRDGVRRAGLLFAASLAVFLFWPRDFERKALFRGALTFTGSGAEALQIGFAETLELRRKGPVRALDDPALSVELLEGVRADVPALWRGATLGATDGETWFPMPLALKRRAGRVDEPWRTGRGSLSRSGRGAPTARLAVVRFEQGTERLFTPLGAVELRLDSDRRRTVLRPRLDGNVDASATEDLRYEIALSPSDSVERGGLPMDPLPGRLAPYVELPRSPSIDAAGRIAGELAAELPADAPQHALVRAFADHLSRAYAYLPPGAEGAADGLAQFLDGSAGGHCEFFASALATMLRSRGVPCRVVTGFRSERWDPATGRLEFRTRDAHAWVEVFDPAGGWYAVDASPSLVAADARPGLLARVRVHARTLWSSVTGFDSERRAALLGWAAGLPGRAVAGLGRHPLASALATLATGALVAAFLRRRSVGEDPAVRAYARALKRARLRLLPGETPREAMERARGGELTAECLAELADATQRHEAERYAA